MLENPPEFEPVKKVQNFQYEKELYSKRSRSSNASSIINVQPRVLMQALTWKYKGIIWTKHRNLVNVLIPTVTHAGTHRTWNMLFGAGIHGSVQTMLVLQIQG